MWVVFAFLTSFLETSKDVIGKKVTRKTDEYTTAFSLQLFGMFILLPAVLITGIPELKMSYWIATAGGMITVPLWSILYMKAVKLSPLSLCVPMLAFNPVFTAVLSIVFDRRLPSFSGWVGIILIGMGLYLLRLEREAFKKGVLHPFLKLREEPGALAMLGVALVWAVGAHLGKMGVRGSSPLFFSFTFILLASIILYFIARSKTSVSFKLIKSNFKYLGPIGFLNGLSELVWMMTLGIGFTPYVVSIKRMNILWSSLMGKLLFKEEFNKIKVLGLILMSLGVLFIILF